MTNHSTTILITTYSKRDGRPLTVRNIHSIGALRFVALLGLKTHACRLCKFKRGLHVLLCLHCFVTVF